MNLEELREKYKEDFNKIVDTILSALNHRPIPHSGNYFISLYDAIDRLVVFEQLQTLYSREDIEQQVMLSWINSIERYKKKKQYVWIKTFLRRMTLWDIKDWLSHELKIPLIDMDPSRPIILPKDEALVMDLDWVFYGTDQFPFSSLSSADRYILYLTYKEDKTIHEIARCMNTYSDKIFHRIHEIHIHLRSLVENESAKSS